MQHRALRHLPGATRKRSPLDSSASIAGVNRAVVLGSDVATRCAQLMAVESLTINQLAFYFTLTKELSCHSVIPSLSNYVSPAPVL